MNLPLQLNQKLWLSVFEKALRLFVFFLLSIYGGAKLVYGQFYVQGHIPAHVASKAIAQVSGFELAWVFFGHSRFYVCFIGFAQVLGALLLLPERSKLFGAAILMPVLLNIIIVDYFYRISFGAMMTAMACLLALIAISLLNRKKVMQVIRAFFAKDRDAPHYRFLHQALLWGAAATLTLLLLYLELQARLVLSPYLPF